MSGEVVIVWVALILGIGIGWLLSAKLNDNVKESEPAAPIVPVVGGLYYASWHDNPFGPLVGQIIMKVLEVRNGYVRYGFADSNLKKEYCISVETFNECYRLVP